MPIQFGFHASGGGHLEKLPLITRDLGGECFQFFSRNPYGGKVKPLDEEVMKKFKDNCQITGVKNSYIHAAYFINLASQNNRIFYGSIKAIQDDIERAELLGSRYVVTHIGSAKDFKEENPLFSNFGKESLPEEFRADLLELAKNRNFSPKAFERVVEGLEKIVAGRKKIPLILEIAAGSGAILGVKIEELAFYLKSVPALSGFCFDTAHAFASGYDLRIEKTLIETFEKIENILLKNKIKQKVAIFEINFEKIFSLLKNEIIYKPISKFQKSEIDLSIIVDKKVIWKDLKNVILKVSNTIESVKLFDVYTGDKIDETKKSLAFRMVFSNSNRNLNQDEIDSLWKEVYEKINKEFGAEIRK